MRTFMLSIKPEYVDKIIRGDKDVEIRTKIPKNISKQGKFLVYSSSPVKKVIGEIHYKDIIEFHSECIKDSDIKNIMHWNYNFGISFHKLFQYAGGKKDFYGFVIDAIIVFKEPKMLADYGLNRPPQNFCYIQ